MKVIALMHACFLQNEAHFQPSDQQPPANVSDAQIMESGASAPIAVQPNSSDVFFAVASGPVGAIWSSCGAQWLCMHYT
jgi:hypothetical protein